MWADRIRGLRGTAARWTEAVLLTLGSVCLGWYGGVRVAAAHEQTKMARELVRAANLPGEGGSYARGDYLPPGATVGRIAVARLNLSGVAREGVDERTLDLAIGHVPGTSLPGEAGNAAFAAHRDTFFRPLRGVRAGDLVTVTTRRGRFRYLVTSTRIVNPDEVSVLAPTSRPTLTLVTCYPFVYIGSAPQRFIVRAELLPR